VSGRCKEGQLEGEIGGNGTKVRWSYGRIVRHDVFTFVDTPENVRNPAVQGVFHRPKEVVFT
jgi:hypothetical protein